jgi:ABC-2 type transport system permease protein
MFVLMGVFFGVAFALDDERAWGTWMRLRASPASTTALLGGKLLARFLVGFAQILLLFVYGRLVFGLSLGSSVVAFVAMCAAVVFSMTGFSLLVSAAARTREQIIPVGLTIIMIVCSIGGCWWPLFQSPEWLQQIAKLFLTSWAMSGLQDLILRESGLSDVAPAIGALVVYGLVCTAAGLWLHGKRRTVG